VTDEAEAFPKTGFSNFSSEMKYRFLSLLGIIVIAVKSFGQPAETIYEGTLIASGYSQNIPLASDGPFPVGFDFNFYGNTYSQFYVSANGLVMFTDPTGFYSTETTIPTAAMPNNYIAPFWDNLSIIDGGNILYRTVGAAPNRKCIIQFKKMAFDPVPTALGTFSVILYENSNNIQMQYRLIVDPYSPNAHGASATIGLENSDGSNGVTYAYHSGSAVTSERAISFTPSGGTYTVNSNAIYDGIFLTTNLTLPDPGIVTLINPTLNAVIGSSQTFEWSSASNASSYIFFIDTLSSLATATNYDVGLDLSFTINDLLLDKTYYWAVFSSNTTALTWCEVKRFSTTSAPPLMPVPQTVWAEKGKDKTIKLGYTGGDASAKSAVIKSLPAQGQLYQYNSGSRGSLINTVPTTVSDAAMNVIYAPVGNTGNGVGNFNFNIIDAILSSPDGTITINVSPPGVPNVLYIAKGPDVEIQFDIPMNDPAGKKDQFTVTVNGSQAAINSASLKEGDQYTILLTLATPLSGAETVLVSYNQGDITGTTGGFLFSFTNEPATLRAQTITFSQSLDKKYNESPFALTATTSSGLGLTYNSSNLSVATFSGSVLVFNAIGTSEITLRQLGDATYAPARYDKTLTVSKGDQSITFNAIPVKYLGDADFSPGASASSGLQISYTSSNTSVATIVGGLIHLVGAGTSQITASQPGSELYNAATDVAQTLTVSMPLSKTLSLSSVFLQGLYDVGGMMRQANDESGAHWPAGVADHISVELHSASGYSTIIYTASDIILNTNGTATVSIPSEFGGQYYITIRHRNSIETTTASPVSFSGFNISQSFALLTSAFENNLGVSFDGRFLIYGGDIDQDGFVGASDMAMVDNQSAAFGMGYIVEDADGDGFVGASDMAIIDNNSANFIFAITP
jgi:hypothetical protein